MHLSFVALITADCDCGNLQEDYHSVAANPSFGGHGTWLSFLHSSLRVGEHSDSQPSPRPGFASQDA